MKRHALGWNLANHISACPCRGDVVELVSVPVPDDLDNITDFQVRHVQSKTEKKFIFNIKQVV